MSLFRNKRRLLFWALISGVVLFAGMLLARVQLTGMAVGFVLRLAGASSVRFTVTEASPWRVVLEDIEFHLRTQPFAARRASFVRAHWWTPSLGKVRIEQVRLPLTIDGSDTDPSSWPTYANSPASGQAVNLPAEEITLDGQLVIRAAALKEQTLAVTAGAHQAANNQWQFEVQLTGPGLMGRAGGSYDPARDELAFELPEVTVEVPPWQDYFQRLMLLPGGNWELAGRLSGQATGRLKGGKLVAGGGVHLHGGSMRNEQRAISAAGMEADLEFVDFARFQTKPGRLRVRELRTGQLLLHDLAVDLSFDTAAKIIVSRAELQGLGGSVLAEPFRYFPNLREVEAVLQVEGVDVAQVMALTKDLPAQATGQVSGRLPIRIDSTGLRFGTGWLAIKPGVYAEVRFNASGLLTNGVAPGHPSYAVLKKIESGLLNLKVTELRLDIRPPGGPAGRTAQLHIAGSPVDPGVKAPVELDLNVNGPLESLLNLGLDSRVSLGTRR